MIIKWARDEEVVYQLIIFTPVCAKEIKFISGFVV
jgi:hypothetical protein